MGDALVSASGGYGDSTALSFVHIIASGTFAIEPSFVDCSVISTECI